MSRATPEDVVNVIKLLERLRTGEMNLIPSVASVGERKEDASTALLRRVEAVLNNHLRHMLEPVGDGGPAFPRSHEHDGHNGMSLRDYFAAKAMQTLINGPAAQKICDDDPRYDETNFAEVVAMNAYEFADAMHKVRG